MHFLWFIKDTAANIDEHFTFYPDEDVLYRINDARPYSNSLGEYPVESFDLQELKTATRIHDRFLQIKSPKSISASVVSPKNRFYDSPIHSTNYNEFNRIERAMLFLESARHTTFPLSKISSYMSMLECLFSTGDTEVSHKVSERVALYIGKNSNDRYKIFKTIKHAYTLRSRFVHGDAVDKKHSLQSQLKEISKEIDGLLRTIFTKVILEDSVMFLLKTQDLKARLEAQIFK